MTIKKSKIKNHTRHRQNRKKQRSESKNKTLGNLNKREDHEIGPNREKFERNSKKLKRNTLMVRTMVTKARKS